MICNTTHSGSFHETCFACGQDNTCGLNLHFVHTSEVSTCTTSIPVTFQSYDGVTHGGVVATLLDAAMVRCLHNKFGGNPFTCRLEIRYRMSIPTKEPITLHASFMKRRGDTCWANAELISNGLLCAKATAAFKLQ